MEKSNLIHTALFCKGWYKIKYLHDLGSFKDFVDNLWKNMAIYISTLVILVSYISLQIYLYSTHKLTFRKR